MNDKFHEIMTSPLAEALAEAAYVKHTAKEWTAAEPGLYYNLPRECYDAIQAVNYSRMKLAKLSLRHYRFTENIGEEALHFRLGDMIHSRILEPEDFANRFTVLPHDKIIQSLFHRVGTKFFPRDKDYKGEGYVKPEMTSLYKNAVSEFQQQHPLKIIVSATEYETLQGICRGLNFRKDVYDIVDDTGKSEATIVWDDPSSGLRCKCRIDYHKTVSGKVHIYDFKSCFSLHDWLRFGIPFDYHLQAAHYVAGMKSQQPPETEVVFHVIPCEKKSPFDCMCRPLSPTALRVGEEERTKLLKGISYATARSCYPGIPAPEYFELPSNYDYGQVSRVMVALQPNSKRSRKSL